MIIFAVIMSSLRKACVFCCKFIVKSSTFHEFNQNVSGRTNADLIKRFLKFLNRFTTAEENYSETVTDFVVGSKLLGCCEECEVVLDKFCEEYHQLTVLELKLISRLESLVDFMRLAGRVPSRWIKLRKMTETNGFEGVKSEDYLESFRRFRENVISKACNTRRWKSSPRVSLNRNELIYLSLSGNKDKTPATEPPSPQGSSYAEDDQNDKTDNFSDEEIKLEPFEDPSSSDQELDTFTYSEIPSPRLKTDNQDLDEHKTNELDDDEIERIDSILRQEGLSDSTNEESEVPHDFVQRRIESSSESESEDDNFQSRQYRLRRKKRRRVLVLESDDEDEHSNQDVVPNSLDPGSYSGLECTKCGKKFLKRKLMFRHIRSVHGTAKFQCTHCSQVFKRVDNLNLHMLSHNDPSTWKYQCSHCPRKFYRKQNLTEHVGRMHREDLKNKTCETCGKRYSTDKDLKQHMKVVHGDAIYQCSECGKAFRNSRYLTKHMLLHTSPDTWKFMCSECGKKYPSKQTLSNHISRTHNACQYKCMECGKEFKVKEKLNIHLFIHQDRSTWKFPCSICDKRYYHKGHLNNHIMRNHKKVK